VRGRFAILVAWCLSQTLFAADVVIDTGDQRDALRLTRAADNERIVIDGHLDETVWRDLPTITDFVVLEPDTLATPPYATNVRLFYTSRGLYLGFDLEQPRDTLIKRLSSRDGFFQVTRDEMSFTIDTSGEGRYGYWFNVALGDSQSDGTILPERQYSNTWDGAWRGATQITSTGWSAEMFIPWGTVSMPASGPTRHMGLYMSRRVGYRDERWGWPALPPTKPKFMSVLNQIEFEGVAPRQQYSISPFAAVTWDEVKDDMEYRVGADLFWRPTTNAQVTATIYPDFGSVETDDLIVNLTATETFFPEKRPFFLEGQEIFVATPRAEPRSRDVGMTGAPYTMVNTRRIGGQPRTPIARLNTIINNRDLVQPVDLLGAAKVTGQSGQFRYGALGAFEDDYELRGTFTGVPFNFDEPGDNYGIARGLYEDSASGAYRAVGVMSTVVTNPDRNALAQGVDAHYLSPTGKLKVDAQAFTSNITDTKDGYGGFVDFEYFIRQGVTQRFGFEYLDSHIDLNDLGYLERNDTLRIRSSHQRTVSKLGWAHENQFDVRGSLQVNHENLFTGGGIFFSDRLIFKDLSKLTSRFSFFPPSYDDINSEGNGTYHIDDRTQTNVRWDSSSARVWGVGIGGGFLEENLGGNTWTGEAQLDWRPSDRFNASIAAVYFNRHGWLLHQVERRMATYDADQWQPKFTVEYYINSKQQLRTSLQWVGIRAHQDELFLVPAKAGDLVLVTDPGVPRDFSISNLILQARYRWEIAPLSDVFVVLTIQANQSRALGDSTFENLFSDAFEDPLFNSLVFKVRYRLGS
jgi:hypothetical protein